MRSIGLAAQGPPSRYGTPSRFGALLPSSRLYPWLTLLGLGLLVKLLLVTVTLVAFGASPDPLTVLGRHWDQWDARHLEAGATTGLAHVQAQVLG